MNRNILGASLVAGALAVAAPQLALAQGTLACTKINNTASVAFTVGGVTQTPQNSSTASFYVGVKVNVVVTAQNSGNDTVYPGLNGTTDTSGTFIPLTFKVANNGNAPQKYALSIAHKTGVTATTPFSGTDVFAEDHAMISLPVTAPTLPSAISSVDNVAPDDFRIVAIYSDTPLSQTDGQVSLYSLTAQSRWVGGSTDITADGTVKGATIGTAACTDNTGVNPPATSDIDVVVADVAGSDDAARDGASSARAAYQVSAANLTITKNSVVIWDPINCSGSTAQAPVCSDPTHPPRLIPGAVVEYTISINNSANGTATVNISDPLDITNLDFFPDGYASTKGISVQAPGYNSGALTLMTNAKDVTDIADYSGTIANAVTVTGLQVAHNDTAVVKFKATIK